MRAKCLPKNTTQCPRPRLEPRAFAPKSSAITTRPPRLPQVVTEVQWKRQKRQNSSVCGFLDVCRIFKNMFVYDLREFIAAWNSMRSDLSAELKTSSRFIQTALLLWLTWKFSKSSYHPLKYYNALTLLPLLFHLDKLKQKAQEIKNSEVLSSSSVLSSSFSSAKHFCVTTI